eukprot:941430_1
MGNVTKKCSEVEDSGAVMQTVFRRTEGNAAAMCAGSARRPCRIGLDRPCSPCSSRCSMPVGGMLSDTECSWRSYNHPNEKSRPPLKDWLSLPKPKNFPHGEKGVMPAMDVEGDLLFSPQPRYRTPNQSILSRFANLRKSGSVRWKSNKHSSRRSYSYSIKALRPNLILPPSPVLRQPECKELLRGVSKVVWLHICATNKEPVDIEKGFWQDDWGCFVVVYNCQKGETPTFVEVQKYISELFEASQPSVECIVLTAVYLHRLLSFVPSLRLGDTNWVAIVFTASLIAQKVQDDECWKNIDFGKFSPIFSIDQINSMEIEFLSAIKWDCQVIPEDYQKYFGVLCCLANNGRPSYANASAIG